MGVIGTGTATYGTGFGSVNTFSPNTNPTQLALKEKSDKPYTVVTASVTNTQARRFEGHRPTEVSD